MTVGLALALLLLLALIVFGLRGWERMVHLRRTHEAALPAASGESRPVGRPATEPDRPRPFRRDATWLAVRADDPRAVARALGLRTVLPANWAAGLAEVETVGVFVTPPVDGWVLAVGRDLAIATLAPARVEQLLPALSAQFGSVQWFATHAEVDYHGWAIAERGQLVRGYAYCADRGHLLWRGDVTGAERALGCFVDDPRDGSDDEFKWWPDRRIVCALARAWSLDPAALDSAAAPPATGQHGRL